MRLVSLACSNTEIVHALGCADQLVGVDDHSDWPPEVVGPLPKVGPDLTPDLDRVERLEPDLILATLTVPGHETIVAELERRGLPFIAPEPISLADVYRDIFDIGQRLGVPERAAQLVGGMKRAIPSADSDPILAGEVESAPTADPTAVAKPVGARPNVVVQWWPKPTIAPGRLSWVHDLLIAAGARHPLADEAVKSRPLSDDELAAADPDAIVISWCGVHPAKYRPDVVLGNPALARTRAVREGRVICIPEAWMGRPGPRLVDGFKALEALVADLR